MAQIPSWICMTHLIIKKKNEVYITIQSKEPHVHQELSDYFTFEVPEAKYLKKNPRYKYWDGTIRLYSPATGDLYHGLMKHVQEWADEKQEAPGLVSIAYITISTASQGHVFIDDVSITLAE